MITKMNYAIAHLTTKLAGYRSGTEGRNSKQKINRGRQKLIENVTDRRKRGIKNQSSI